MIGSFRHNHYYVDMRHLKKTDHASKNRPFPTSCPHNTHVHISASLASRQRAKILRHNATVIFARLLGNLYRARAPLDAETAKAISANLAATDKAK